MKFMVTNIDCMQENNVKKKQFIL